MFTPKYAITNKILFAVGKIEAAREAIGNASLVPVWEMKFKEEALIKTIHFATHAEGNILSKVAAEKIIRQDLQRDERANVVAQRAGVSGSEEDVQEVINFRNAMKYVDQLVRLSESGMRVALSEKELVQLQSLIVERMVPSNEIGVYRKQMVEQKESAIDYPQPVEVPYQIEDFFRWLAGLRTGEMYPVIKAAIVMYELMRIYPFKSGSMKTARTYAYLSLAIDGYTAKQLFSFDEYFDKNRESGIKIMERTENGDYDLTEFIEFFVDGLASEFVKLKEKVKRLSVDFRHKDGSGKQLALTERQIALIEVLELKGEINMAGAREVIPMVSDDTILRDLKVLVGKKLIKKRGSTKGSRYILAK